MVQWLSILFIIMAFLLLEMAIYVFYLIIRALRTYIKKNSETNYYVTPKEVNKKSKAGIISIAIFNVLIVIFIVVMPFIQKNHDIYYTKNVIICNSKDDVEKFTELLDENNIDYKTLGSTKVKMQNIKDFTAAENIIKENYIGYSVVTVVN